jgi:hypothetical protein
LAVLGQFQVAADSVKQAKQTSGALFAVKIEHFDAVQFERT